MLSRSHLLIPAVHFLLSTAGEGLFTSIHTDLRKIIIANTVWQGVCKVWCLLSYDLLYNVFLLILFVCLLVFHVGPRSSVRADSHSALLLMQSVFFFSSSSHELCS